MQVSDVIPPQPMETNSPIESPNPVLVEDDEDFLSLIDLNETLDSILEEAEDGQQNPSAQPSPRPVQICKRCQGVGHQDLTCPRRPRPPRTEEQADLSNSSNEEAEENASPPPRRRTNNCRKCHKPGHNAATCRRENRSSSSNRPEQQADLNSSSKEEAEENPSPPPRRRKQHKCRLCHMEGHNTRTCPTNNQLESNSGDSDHEGNNRGRPHRRVQECGLCHQPGHTRATCPLAPGRQDAPRRNVPDIDLQMDIDDQHCRGCYRISTPNFIFELNRIPIHPTSRKHGRKGLKRGDKMCPECLKYFSTRGKPKQASAWPAYFFSLLTDNSYSQSDEKRDVYLRNFFAITIRESYNKLVLSTDKALYYFRRYWEEIEANIVDMTLPINNFSEKMEDNNEKKVLYNLKSGMDETGFPSIRCPVGCFDHVENVLDKDEEYYNFVPFQHFMAKFVPTEARAFDMKERQCNIFKPDWPKPVLHLDKYVNPSIYLHPVMGLTILMCPDHDSSQEFLHIPVNPFKGSHSTPVDNLAAPVNVMVNAGRRKGGTGPRGDYGEKVQKKNTHYDTVTLLGSNSGVSTFYMAPDDSVDWATVTRVDKKAAKLTFDNRPEIYVSSQKGLNRDHFKKMAGDVVYTAEEEEKIQEALKGSTYIPKADILNIVKNQQEKGVAVGDSMAVKNIVTQVHPTDEWGAQLPKLPTFLQAKKSAMNVAITNVISLLITNKAVYCRFLRQSKRTPGAAYDKINKMLYLVNGGKLDSKFLKEQHVVETFLGIITSFDQNFDVNDETSAQSVTRDILRELLGAEIFLEVSNDNNICIFE